MTRHAQGRFLFEGNVTQYEDRFLICRDTGHRWRPGAHWSVSRAGRRAIEYRRDLPCDTCGTVRHDRFDADMRPAGISYTYPSGYVKAPTVADLDAAAARLEQLRRYGSDLAPRRLRTG